MIWSPLALISNVTRPSSVYFTALLIKFKITCFVCNTSPVKYFGSSSSASITKSIFFASACFVPIIHISCISCLNSNFSSVISSFPDSILVISNMLLISDNKYRPAFSTLSAYWTISFEADSLKIISFIPSITLIGVRISWLIFARKILFAWFASIASSLACVRKICCFL